MACVNPQIRCQELLDTACVFLLCNSINSNRLPFELHRLILLSLGVIRPTDVQELYLLPDAPQDRDYYYCDDPSILPCKISPIECVICDATNCLDRYVQMGGILSGELYRTAIEYGRINSLKYLHRMNVVLTFGVYLDGVESKNPVCVQWFIDNFTKSHIVCSRAIKKKNYDLLFLLLQEGFPIDNEAYMQASRIQDFALQQRLVLAGFPACETFIESSAARGDIGALQWFVSVGVYKFEGACSAAAGNGQLECLSWLINNQFPKTAHSYLTATRGGHLNCLKLMFKYNFPIPITDLYVAAIESGKCEVLKWIYDHKFPRDLTSEYPLALAAQRGNIDCLTFLHKKKFRLSQQAAINAIENGHYSCLKFISSHYKIFDLHICAIKCNQPRCLKLLIRRRIPYIGDLCLEAAILGRYECLKVLFEHGYDCNREHLRYAVSNCHGDCAALIRKRIEDIDSYNSLCELRAEREARAASASPYFFFPFF